MVKLTKVLTAQTIDEKMMSVINDTTHHSVSRGYNGLSAIGEKCHRKLQFIHYNAATNEYSARMLRLFNFGKDMEETLIRELMHFLKISVTDAQKECIGFSGHWKGHIDGIGRFFGDDNFGIKDEFLLEFKTHNAKSFADLKKNGMIMSKPVHFGQVTAYMGYLKLDKCLYVAYNKDTSEVYLEFVDFEEDYFKELKRKEAEIIMADTLLPRIGNDSPMWFECKLCDHSDVCFGKKAPNRNCKTCQYVDVKPDGVWECSKGFDADVNVGCDLYLLSEMLNVN